MARTILIFGSSHAGKSTLAQQLGDALGWPVRSTDQMGRHPGRPWPELREPVAEFYERLSDETIYWFLKLHQDNMWPHVRAQILAEGGVLEGAALRPEFIATLPQDGIDVLGLYGGEALIRARIHAASDYAQQDAARQRLIDKFLTRSLRQNEEMAEQARALGLPLVDVGDADALAAATAKLIAGAG